MLKSGCAAATGVVGVMLGEALFEGTLSPGVATVPVNTGVVPTVLFVGVTGTWIVLVPPEAIGPGSTHVTS